MKRAAELVGVFAVAAGFMAGLGALGALALQRLAPWTGGYGRGALWGAAELGFWGLTFFASIRNRVGFAILLATLPLGALWGLAVLGAWRLAGRPPGPYAFSISLAVAGGFVVYLIAVGVALAGRKKSQA